MPYNEIIAGRIREQFVLLTGVEEKEMMGGLAFMYKEKMCVGVFQDSLMCRIDPALYEDALERNGCRPMSLGGQAMKGWVLVDQETIKSKTEFEYWMDLALDYNSRAKKSKKR